MDLPKTPNQRTYNRGQTTVIRLPSSVFRLHGFTLVELVVAIGIMAMVILFSGMVFKTSIGSYRIATAQAEIIQKFRAITQQLDSDFRELHIGTPVIVWFEVTSDSNDRFDQILFFPDGDFQSVQTYDIDANGTSPSSGFLIPQQSTGLPIAGNVARIQYGHASVYSQSMGKYLEPNEQLQENNLSDRVLNKNLRTLARRQHILTADPNVFQWPDSLASGTFINSFDPNRNDAYEHDTNSLSQWQGLMAAYPDYISDVCFRSRPRINLQGNTGLHMLMAEGVTNFTIQLTVDDPNGSFSWHPDNDEIRNGTGPAGYNWPRAIKFTFTLYDSRSVFKDGQTFTHIVYIGE